MKLAYKQFKCHNTMTYCHLHYTKNSNVDQKRQSLRSECTYLPMFISNYKGCNRKLIHDLYRSLPMIWIGTEPQMTVAVDKVH